MTNARKTWWYAVGQTKVGPCSSAELMDLVAQGKVFPDTLVWKEGMADWVPASRIKGLWQNLPATPPAAPPLPASASSIGASLPPVPPMPQPDQQFGGFTPPPAPQASTWPEEDEYEEELPPREEMTFKKAVERCFKKYFDFSGRAGRAEFWYFFLFNILISIPFAILIIATGGESASIERLADIVNLALFIPNTAVAARRLHDTGRSGWWQLIAFTGIGIFFLLYWYIKEGDDDANEYGYPE
ncbi:MAG: DUF805 domain-containing protein [Brachymonas sp.]|nr:DUF805 domain-containing protein [Brachymonas sp.]